MNAGMNAVRNIARRAGYIALMPDLLPALKGEGSL